MAAMAVVLLCCLIELLVGAFAAQGQSRAAEAKLRGPYSTLRAMQLLYGSNRPGNLSWAPLQRTGIPSGWPKTLAVHLVADIPYVEMDRATHLLITYAVPQSQNTEDIACHSCKVLLGFASFSETGETWQLEAEDLHFGLYGEFGQPPAISLQPLGPNRYGVQVLEGFSAQDWSWQDLTIVMPTDHRFKTVFSTRVRSSCGTDLDGDRARKCKDLDSGLSFILDPKTKDYYGLVMTERFHVPATHNAGTSSDRFVRRTYFFDGDRFVEEKK